MFRFITIIYYLFIIIIIHSTMKKIMFTVKIYILYFYK